MCITFAEGKWNNNIQIIVRDIYGKNIITKKGDIFTYIDLTHYAKGVYILQININNKLYSEKIIKN